MFFFFFFCFLALAFNPLMLNASIGVKIHESFSRELVLGMHFLKHVNILQWMKKSTKV
jgi:hypothetical protein